MIRIRNIARENRNLRHREDTIYLPKGRVRVNERREIVIDYATYLMNKTNIALPGVELTDKNTFRVVAGVEEIRSNIMESAEQKADSVASETGITQPTTPEKPIVDAPPLVTDNPNAEENPNADGNPNADENPNADGNPNAEGTTNAEEDNKPKIIFTHGQLDKLTHQKLDELLTTHGVTVPQQSNKQVKIDALLRLNNG